MSQQGCVSLLDPLWDATVTSLDEAPAAVLGRSGPEDRDDTCIDTLRPCLTWVAWEGARPVMPGPVPPEAAARGRLGGSTVHDLRYVWTLQIEDWNDEVPWVVGPDDAS